MVTQEACLGQRRTGKNFRTDNFIARKLGQEISLQKAFCYLQTQSETGKAGAPAASHCQTQEAETGTESSWAL